MQYPNIHTAFGGVTPQLPRTQQEADDFGNRVETALSELLAIARSGGIVPQLVHNAHMLERLMALAYGQAPALVNASNQRVAKLMNDIFDIYEQSPYAMQSFMPPGLPVDPVAKVLYAQLWPRDPWLTHTLVGETPVDLSGITPIVQTYVPASTPQTVAPVVTQTPTPQTQTPVNQSLATGPTNDTILGFPLWQIGIAAVAVLLFINMK